MMSDEIAAEEDDEQRGKHIKTVYAHFGLAIYLAQCLEHSIVNALVFCDLIPKNAHTVKRHEEWGNLFDAFMSHHFAKPLGRVIGSLKEIVSVPEELEEILAKALKRRNWLAHAYFRERVLPI